MRLSPEQISNIWARFIEWAGHWFSMYYRDQRSNKVRLRVEGQRVIVSHPRLLWFTSYGSWPVGQLVNVCDEPLCIRPDHYRDGFDEQQQLWQREATRDQRLNELEGVPHSVRDGNQDGMTADFGCYSCGVRFDPLAGKSEVLCDPCFLR